MKLINTVYIALGFLCFGLGTVGIILPILPTTPFYLLTAFFFAKGSQRFHTWFIGTKLYRKHLDSFVKNRSMTLKTKLSILIPVTVMMFVPMVLVNALPMTIGMILLVAFKYYYFFFRIRTITPEEKAAEKAAAKSAADGITSAENSTGGRVADAY